MRFASGHGGQMMKRNLYVGAGILALVIALATGSHLLEKKAAV